MHGILEKPWIKKKMKKNLEFRTKITKNIEKPWMLNNFYMLESIILIWYQKSTISLKLFFSLYKIILLKYTY